RALALGVDEAETGDRVERPARAVRSRAQVELRLVILVELQQGAWLAVRGVESEPPLPIGILAQLRAHRAGLIPGHQPLGLHGPGLRRAETPQQQPRRAAHRDDALPSLPGLPS